MASDNAVPSEKPSRSSWSPTCHDVRHGKPTSPPDPLVRTAARRGRVDGCGLRLRDRGEHRRAPAHRRNQHHAAAPLANRPTNDALVNAFDYAAPQADGQTAYYFTSPSKRWVCAIVPRVAAGCQSSTGSTIPIKGRQTPCRVRRHRLRAERHPGGQAGRSELCRARRTRVFARSRSGRDPAVRQGPDRVRFPLQRAGGHRNLLRQRGVRQRIHLQRRRIHPSIHRSARVGTANAALVISRVAWW